MPGGANATMLDGTTLQNGQIALAVGWAGGTTLFRYDVAANAWQAASVESFGPAQVAITAVGGAQVRVTTVGTAVRTRGVSLLPSSIVPSASSYSWGPSTDVVGLATARWRNQLGIAIAGNNSARAVFRVLDRTFPVQ